MKFKKTEISVIIPTLNEEKNIDGILTSLKNQKYKNFEIIIADGGSTDRTIEKAKKYRVRILSLKDAKKKGRVPYQRNMGARIAKGSILAFTEADVRFPKDWTENIHKIFKGDKELISIGGPGYPYDCNSIIGSLEFRIYNLIRYFFNALPKPFKRFLANASNIVIRKDIFEKIGGYKIVLISDDGIIIKDLLKIGKVKFCPKLKVFVSARRFNEMGFLRFNLHYLYMLENVFYFLSPFVENIKKRSAKKWYRSREVIKIKNS